MTEIAFSFAERWGVSPFEILEKDIDDFILIANQIIRKQDTVERTDDYTEAAASRKDDGFWDF